MVAEKDYIRATIKCLIGHDSTIDALKHWIREAANPDAVFEESRPISIRLAIVLRR